ncbi:MAG: dipeptide epimerase [Planctomycetota bacterium]
MKLALHTYDLALRHRFTIARGSKTHQRTLIVELNCRGVRGYGEAPHYPYYGATVEGVAAALRRTEALLSHAPADDPEALWDAAGAVLADDPFARCALDEAAWDLAGKLAGRPVWALWDLSIEQIPPSSYTIGIDTIEAMIAKLDAEPDWPVYKIKLGTDDDVAIVRALRKRIGARFRVDANCGWSVDQAIACAPALAEAGVAFIEQPLPGDDYDGAARVRAASPLPLFADESCVGEADVDRCTGAFDGINIKLTKCGGLTPARRMIARARELGLGVMIGCMTESTVGISAAAQVLGLVDHADLDGAVLLADDTATGVAVTPEGIRYPDSPGTGVTGLTR